LKYKKGKRTIKKLSLAHNDFTLLVNWVLQYMDIGVYESARKDKRQLMLFNTGKSQIDGINDRSFHQVKKKKPLSNAIDVFPYLKGHNSFDGSDKSKLMFYEMNWLFYRASIELNIPINQGYLWSFKDSPHQQLKKG